MKKYGSPEPAHVERDDQGEAADPQGLHREALREQPLTEADRQALIAETAPDAVE